MAQRISSDEVLDIIDVQDGIVVQPFIMAASLVIDTNLASAGLTAGLLKEIERWLSAHFLAIRDPRFTQVKTDSDTMVFEHGKTGMGLKATMYGQQALSLDPTGILAALDTTPGKRASIKVD